MRFLILFIYFFITCASADPVIIQKPILFNHERIELTREYRKQHYDIDEKSIVIIPQMIVLHWTASESLKNTFNYFYPPTLAKGRPEIGNSSILNVASQFLVDKNGTIYQLMPANWMARHTIGLNNIAIGIENVGGENDKQDLTEAQVNADVAIIRQLVKQYPTIHYLIGHYEYLQFKDSPLWEEKNPAYFTNKADPGEIFMQQVREKVADLHLKSAP